MRIFVDTSALFKKYVEEPGSAEFDKLLAKADEVAISPLTWVEINAAVERRVRDHHLAAGQAEQIRLEVKKDLPYYWCVIWNENLTEKAVEIVRKHALKTLDSIQLASGILSEPDLFVTSDRKLYKEARKIIPGSRLV